MIYSDVPAWFGVFFTVFGAVVGSFLNVVIYRVPAGFRVGLPTRSACQKCKTQLTWFENIPVLSFALLRGKCRTCGTKIHARYPLVELITALMFLAIYKYFGLTFAAFYYALFASLLISITFIDLDHRIIPDALSLPGTAMGVIGSSFVFNFGLAPSLIGAVAGGGFFWILSALYHKVTGREGLGFGDVKLLTMIGAFLGPKGAFGTVIMSSLVGSIAGITVMIVQKKNMKMAIPYGPFLAIGALTYLFWGDYLEFRYFGVVPQ